MKEIQKHFDKSMSDSTKNAFICHYAGYMRSDFDTAREVYNTASCRNSCKFRESIAIAAETFDFVKGKSINNRRSPNVHSVAIRKKLKEESVSYTTYTNDTLKKGFRVKLYGISRLSDKKIKKVKKYATKHGASFEIRDNKKFNMYNFTDSIVMYFPKRDE